MAPLRGWSGVSSALVPPYGYFGQLVTYAVDRSQFEFFESSEKVVVAGIAGAVPVAHRPGVDQLIVENSVVIGAADGWFVGVLGAGCVAGRGRQARDAAVDAEIVLGCVVDPIFRIHGTGQMIVEITTLRHLRGKDKSKDGFW